MTRTAARVIHFTRTAIATGPTRMGAPGLCLTWLAGFTALALHGLLLVGCERGGTPRAAAPGGPPSLDIVTTELPSAVKGESYRARIETRAGTPADVRFRIAAGALPRGLLLDPGTGLIEGIALETGAFAFTMAASSGASQAARTLPITVSGRSGFSAPLPRIHASRLSGPAPLSVFLDATETASSKTARPFHELGYTWTFGDPHSRRSRASGALAAHVFDRPGLYPVKLAVQDQDGATAWTGVLITVQDPDQVFAGTATICFANADGFAEAPPGAQRVISTSLDEVLRHAGAGRRLLLRRGDRFTLSEAQALGFGGPFHLGAFGRGIDPDARGIYANNPLVLVDCAASCLRPGGTDQRLTDLTFRAATATAGALVHAGYRTERLLLARVRFEGFNMAVCIHHDLIQYYNIDPHDQLTFADCVFSGVDGRFDVVLYTGGRRLAFLGNEFENRTGVHTHLLRITYADRAVIGSNQFRSATGSRHCIKLHGPTWPAHPQVSRLIQVADNCFESGVAWLATFGPQDEFKDERVQDVIVERNLFRPLPGARICLYVGGSETTIRNNVFQDVLGAPAAEGYIHVGRRGVEPLPTGAAIQHNTVWCDHGRGGPLVFARLVEHQGGAVSLKNNLLSAPGMAQILLVHGNAPVDAAGNLVTPAACFAGAALGDFALLPGSPAIDIGVPTPCLGDFEGSLRPAPGGAPDAGAFEHH